MELRGVGIINARNLFGMGSVKKSSKLDMPFNLKLYKEVEANSKLNSNKELMEALWKLNF